MNAFGASFYVQDFSSDAFAFADMLAGFANGGQSDAPPSGAGSRIAS
jgi:hypothetical protein